MGRENEWVGSKYDGRRSEPPYECAACAAKDAEIEMLRSEGVIKQVTAQRDTIQRETWAAALRHLADHEDHNGAGNHGRTGGRVSDCIGDLEQVFRAAAQETP